MDYRLGEFVTPWGAEVKAFYREGTNDWNTLTSCLTEDEYRIGSLEQVPVFSDPVWAIDIGGNIGAVTLALLSRGYRVLMVEPLPENVVLAIKSVKLNGWVERFEYTQRAITENDFAHPRMFAEVLYGDTTTSSGKHHEYIGVTAWADSDTLALGRRVATVLVTNIDELVYEISADIELLKIDCEGAEWDAFSSVSSYTLSRIKRIAAELHPLKGMTDPRGEFTKLLKDKYDDISVQIYGTQTVSPSPTLAYYKLK